MKKRSIFDIIKTASDDCEMLKKLADELREKKPKSTAYIDEAIFYLVSLYDALHYYLDSLAKEGNQQIEEI